MSYEVPRSAYRGLACIKCGVVPPRRLNCSRCKRVIYCDEHCQKADYRDHMHFCRAWSILREKETPVVKLECKQDCDQYRASLEKRIKWTCRELTVLLGRIPYRAEQRLIILEPRCAVCFRTDYDLEQKPDFPGQRLLCCTGCFSFFSCSDEHLKFVGKTHVLEPYEPGGTLTRCKMHQLMVLDDEEETAYCHNWAKPIWFPDRILSNYIRLSKFPCGDAWKKWFLLPETQWPHDTINRLELRTASAHLSFPMTVAYGMEIFDNPRTRALLEKRPGSSTVTPTYQTLRSRSSLEVHVIGIRGNHVAANQAMVFEELQHLLPACKQLIVRFFGPDLINHPTLCYEVPFEFDDMGYGCDACRAHGLIRIQSMHPQTYHEWVQEQRHTSSTVSKPDLAVCFDSGMLQSIEYTALWIPTLQLLLDARIPTIVTDMAEKEACASANLLSKLGGMIAWEPRRNPWKNEQGLADFSGNDEFHFANHYVFGFCGRSFCSCV